MTDSRPSSTIDTLSWLAHQHWEHRDRFWWRRWRLAAELLRRGVFARQPLQGNMLHLIDTGRIEFGERVRLDTGVRIWGGPDAKVILASGAGLGRNVAIGAVERVEIGAHSLVAQGSYITDSDHILDDPDSPIAGQGQRVKGPIIIEDNVWIGANCVVTSGVRIGRGSVVGAGSVVTHDVPPFSIATGVPAVARSRPGWADTVTALRTTS